MKRIMLVLLLCLLSVTGCGDRMTKVKDLRRAGITAMEEGDYQKAAEQFRHAMAYYGTARQEGTELDILRYLSEAEMCSEDYVSAAETLRRLMEADGRKNEYLNMLAVCVVRSGGELEEALALYNEAGDCLRVGKYYFEAGDYAWAREVFRQGQALADQELLAEGLAEEQAALIRSTLRDLRFNEAVCLEYEKDYVGALAIMEEIAGEYGEDEALEHEILFLRSRT